MNDQEKISRFKSWLYIRFYSENDPKTKEHNREVLKYFLNMFGTTNQVDIDFLDIARAKEKVDRYY